MLIGLATPADVDTLADLGTATFRETFGHLYRPEDLRDFLDTARSCAAFARLLRDPDTAILLERALDRLASVQHRAPVYVGVWSGNVGAQRLYERFGFRKIGEYDFRVGDQLDREFILARG
jgi:hypothetical protein